MPTGYTSKLYDGKEVTFKDFLLECSRAFRIDARDNNGKLPETVSVDKYYKGSLIDAEKAFIEWQAIAKPERMALWNKLYNDSVIYHTEQCKKAKILKDTYDAMLSKIQNWVHPEELHELKNFMIQQLNTSIRCDCDFSYHELALLDKQESFEDWEMIYDGFLQGNIKSSKDRLEESEERCARSNQWLRILYSEINKL